MPPTVLWFQRSLFVDSSKRNYDSKDIFPPFNRVTNAGSAAVGTMVILYVEAFAWFPSGAAMGKLAPMDCSVALFLWSIGPLGYEGFGFALCAVAMEMIWETR